MNFQFICVDCGTVNELRIRKGVKISSFCKMIKNMKCQCGAGFMDLVIESSSITFELDVARR